MGKKKKNQSPEAILARAEEMFRRKNYLLAVREFQKAAGMTGGENLAQKIELCNRKLEEARADDLVKRARKFTGTGDIKAALRAFEEAHAITGEEWISQKVEELKQATQSQDLSMAAEEAEIAGDYAKAAELYGEMFGDKQGDDLLGKRARCLVLAGKYEEAVSLFQNGNLADVRSLYDWGFALAKTGRYCECLKVWEKIPSENPEFLRQKEVVRDLLACELVEGYERGDDAGTIYQQGRYLLDGLEKQEVLMDVVKSCGYAWLRDLFEDEQFERIMEILDSWPFPMDPTLLQVCAKSSFKLAEKSGTGLNDLSMYWLSAVYAAQAADGRSALREGVWLREELIRRGENLLKRSQGVERGFAEAGLSWWKVERGLLEELCDLADGRKKDLHFFICSPRLASRYGISDAIVALIRTKRKRFKNLERYLNTGAFYSAAGEALYLLEKGDHAKALQSLPDGDAGDEFSLWGIQRVIFACGIHSMNKGESPLKNFPDIAVALLDQVPRFEKELIDGAANAEEVKQLSRYEDVLAAIHAIHPRKELDQALSYVMSRRALKMYNADHGNDKVLAIALQKALVLDPENEHARTVLADARVELERMEMEKALDAHKMGRACKIAMETEHEKVREAFFEFFEDFINELDEADLESAEKIVSLNRIYSWCARVDDEHEILDEIEEMIEELEEVE